LGGAVMGHDILLAKDNNGSNFNASIEAKSRRFR